MDEETQIKTEGKETKEDAPKESVPGENDSTDGIPAKTETTPLIDVANAVADRIEKGNAETAKLLDRQEAMEQRRALGGQTQAGQEPEKPKPETDEEYTARFMAGEVNPMKEDVK